ncbi:MAG: hypothetical protein BWK80_00985 [Desulfobacteraceae bacterium IS3]|nr:MAG: hypothetical protein BWK80_00985 [Desulfobacteraceae bacterium IS3]
MNTSKIIRMSFLYLFIIGIVCRSFNAGADPRAKAAFYDPNAAGETRITDSDETSGDKGIVRKKPVPVPDIKPKESADYYSKVKPGIMYWIELVSPDNAPQRVSNDRIFRSGDKIRLHISANADGYLCVLHEGSTGTSKIIPISDAGNGGVRMGADYVIPSKKGWLRFDNNPGEEKLKLLFAPVNSSPDVLNVMQRSFTLTGTESVDQLIDIYDKYKENRGILRHVESGMRSRDLFVEDGDMPETDFNVEVKPDFKTQSDIYNAPANYVVNIAADRNLKEPVAVQISLLHRSETP